MNYQVIVDCFKFHLESRGLYSLVASVVVLPLVICTLISIIIIIIVIIIIMNLHGSVVESVSATMGFQGLRLGGLNYL